MEGILENTFLNIKNNSKTIVAKVSLEGNDKGIILCQGGKFGGWALYMNDGKPDGYWRTYYVTGIIVNFTKTYAQCKVIINGYLF